MAKFSSYSRFKARLSLLSPFSGHPISANCSSITDNDKIEKILCIPAAGIGDVIMVAPAIAALEGETARWLGQTKKTTGLEAVFRQVQAILDKAAEMRRQYMNDDGKVWTVDNVEPAAQ